MAIERPWDVFLTGQDRVIHEKVGAGEPFARPKRPALVIVNTTLDSFGPEGVTAIEAVAVNPAACGPRAWRTVPAITVLLKSARAARIPIVYVRRSALWLAEERCRLVRSAEESAAGNAFLPQLAPSPADTILGATKASAFWKTGLEAHLEDLGVDGLVLGGGRTSTCVRATAMDAFYRDLPVFIVPEAVFDLYEASHAMALFDCQANCADLLTLEAATALLAEA